MDEQKHKETHQPAVCASASNNYKQKLKQTYAFWTFIQNQTIFLTSLASYAAMYSQVFFSIGFPHLCSVTALITFGQMLVVPFLVENQSTKPCKSGQQHNNQLVHTGAYRRLLSYIAAWSVLIGEFSTLSINASYCASAACDLMGFSGPNSQQKVYPALLIYLAALARPAIFDWLSKQLVPRKDLLAELSNVSSCLFLAFAIRVETDSKNTNSASPKGLDPSGRMSKDRVINWSMSVLLYTLYGFDGVIYFISEMKDITRDTPSFLIWTMVMAGPVACLSTTIVWLTPGSNWAFYYKVTSEYLTRLCRSIESSHPGSHVWFALILTGLNSFMIANVYTAGSVFIWSMT